MAILAPSAINGNGKTSSDAAVIALIYRRVSSDDQAKEGLSLEAQLADDRRYVAQHGWIIGGEYEDILSGKRDDRKDYQRMLADARRLRVEGRPVVIVVKWLHRLGRRVLERVRSREEMKAIGVALHSVAEGGEVSDLVANILASVAEEETRQLSERVSSVRQHTVGKGWAFPGRAAWGYRWRERTEAERAQGAPRQVLEVDPVTMPYVLETFRRVAAGESSRSVMRWIRGLPEVARSGERFDAKGNRTREPLTMALAELSPMLRSPTYIGRSVRDGQELPGRWPAIIEEETWRKVQERIDSHQRLAHQATGRYLLTGFLCCPRCGGRMQASTSPRQKLYRCADCHETASMPKMDRAVMHQVVALIDTLLGADFDAALHAAWESLRSPAKGDEGAVRIAQLERERGKTKERLVRQVNLLADGLIDKAAYDLARDSVEHDLKALDDELSRLRAQEAPSPKLPPLGALLGDLGGWQGILHDPDPEGTRAKREVLAVLLESVTPVHKGFAKYDATVTWTATGEMLREVVAALAE